MEGGQRVEGGKGMDEGEGEEKILQVRMQFSELNAVYVSS